MSGKEFLKFAADYRKLGKDNRMQEMMDRFELNPKGKIKKLSKGMKQKLDIVVAFMHDPDILVLDEPTRNFSPLSNPVIRKALKSFGGAIISVSHDRKYLKEVCDTLYRFMEKGLILTDHSQL